ncbi:MAG: hypothetical protein WCR42_01960 [bacterium]
MKKVIFILMFISLSVSFLSAQTVDDALRYARPNGMVTARTAGLGVSYHGILDDMGALFYNPAGLALIPKTELSVGFGYESSKTQTNYLNVLTDYPVNKGYLSNIGLITPVYGASKNAALGIGYFYESSFNGTQSFDVYNPSSSIIADESYNGPQKIKQNWAYELYLADFQGDKLATDYKGEVQQNNFVEETGGIHNITGGFGLELSDYLSMGMSVIGKWGSYHYYRDYRETDKNNMHQIPILGKELKSLQLEQFQDSYIAGISGMIGLQGRIGKYMRAAVGVQLPTYYGFNEEYSTTYYADYTDNTNAWWSPDSLETMATTYSITTPFIYSAGFSANVVGLTITAGVEYCDVTQLVYKNGVSELTSVNRDIKTDLTPETKYGLGLEYQIPGIPLTVRGSYENTTNPYVDNSPNSNYTNIAFGAGVYLGENIRLDAVIRWSDYSTKRVNYGTFDTQYYSDYSIKNTPLNVTVGLTYRY